MPTLGDFKALIGDTPEGVGTSSGSHAPATCRRHVRRAAGWLARRDLVPLEYADRSGRGECIGAAQGGWCKGVRFRALKQSRFNRQALLQRDALMASGARPFTKVARKHFIGCCSRPQRCRRDPFGKAVQPTPRTERRARNLLASLETAPPRVKRSLKPWQSIGQAFVTRTDT